MWIIFVVVFSFQWKVSLGATPNDIFYTMFRNYVITKWIDTFQRNESMETNLS